MPAVEPMEHSFCAGAVSPLDQARISSTEANQAIVRLRSAAPISPARPPHAISQGEANGAAWGPPSPTASLAVAWVGVICVSTSSARRSASRSACCSTTSSSPMVTTPARPASCSSSGPHLRHHRLRAPLRRRLRLRLHACRQRPDERRCRLLAVLAGTSRTWPPASSSVPSPPVLRTAPRGGSKERACRNQGPLPSGPSAPTLSPACSTGAFQQQVLEQHISSAGTSALPTSISMASGRSTTAAGTTSATSAGRRRASPARLPARQRPGRAHRR